LLRKSIVLKESWSNVAVSVNRWLEEVEAAGKVTQCGDRASQFQVSATTLVSASHGNTVAVLGQPEVSLNQNEIATSLHR